MTMRPITIALAGILCMSAAHAVDLPSNDEMIQMGRQKIGDFNDALNKAQSAMVMQPMKGVNLPEETQKRSPIEKELLNDTMREAPNIGKPSAQKAGSDLIVFVSFSMPDDELKSYTEQAREAGATIVLRGMIDHSLEKTKHKAWDVSHGRSAWEINPSLFRKFEVTKVPAIVLANGDSSVTESGCAPAANFLRVDGSVAIRQALLLMRRYGEKPLANDAAARLDKLEHQK